MNRTDQELLKIVASSLGPLNKDVVFVGGVTTSLYIENDLSPRTTPTDDVDIIVNIVTRLEYDEFTKKLSKLGFKQFASRPGPICRFYLNDISVDIMPLNEKILGFSNKWYSDGFNHSIEVNIGDLNIRTLSFEYFLATKIEAFMDRAKNRPLYDSKDFEDIIVALDGRKDLTQDLNSLIPNIKREFKEFLKGITKDVGKLQESIAACLMDYGSQIASEKAVRLINKLDDI